VFGSRGFTIRSMRSGVLVVAIILASVAPAAFPSDADVATLLADAEASFDRWSGTFDFVAYEAALRTAIDLWEEALVRLPEQDTASRILVLNRLAQTRFELAMGYLTDKRDREATFELGKDAALAALELDPTFVATRQADGFRAALRVASDVETIFWYANTLGQWLDFHRMTAIFGGVRDVGAALERSIELDETLAGGGPHRSMAAFLAQAYFVVGRSRGDAVAHFERSIELDSTYLENYVNYAEYYAHAIRDDVLFDRLIAIVLEAAEDPGIVGAHPLYNHLAIERARALAED